MIANEANESFPLFKILTRDENVMSLSPHCAIPATLRTVPCTCRVGGNPLYESAHHVALCVDSPAGAAVFGSRWTARGDLGKDVVC